MLNKFVQSQNKPFLIKQSIQKRVFPTRRVRKTPYCLSMQKKNGVNTSPSKTFPQKAFLIGKRSKTEFYDFGIYKIFLIA